MEIRIQFKGLEEVVANMDDLAKSQLPFAMKEAINKSTEDAHEAIKKQMLSSIAGGPTAWTLNSLYIKYATKTKLASEFGYKDKNSIRVTTTNKGQGTPAAYYMAPNIEGGQRNLKGFELALQQYGILPKGMYVAPGAACPLDANGNIPHSFIMQIISYFKASERWKGHLSNITDKRKAALAKGSKKSGFGYEYFASYGPGTRSGRQHLPAGIYKRVSFSQGSAIKPIMMFTKSPSYQKRFPFFEVAQQTINATLMTRFDESMKEALLTARRTG
jgi:hypothetical protein